MDYYSTRFEAELLLAHALGISRAGVLARVGEALAPADAARYDALAARRAQGEPIAYILGHKEFYGLDLVVDQRVLIPRPETELVVELALKALKKVPHATPRVADVGTGAGAIAIAIAAHAPQARIVATDISPDALAVAQLNAQRLNVQARITFQRGDLLAGLTEPFDIIAANLPYIPLERLARLPREIREHEPRVALDGGRGGLSVICRLLEQAEAHLTRAGVVLLEISEEQGREACALAAEFFPRALVSLHRDLEGLERVVEIQMMNTEILPAAAADAQAKALALLRAGAVIALPTDTVYGVAADGFDADAIEKLYAVKERPRDKAIPLLLADASDLDQVASELPEAVQRLVQEFWPGALTLVVPARASVPAILRAGGNSVAVRVPAHPLVRALARQLGQPLAATSANLSGGRDPSSAAEVMAQLGGRIPLILDGGPSGHTVPSTVIDLTVSPPRLVRAGALAVEAIQALLHVRLQSAIRNAERQFAIS